MQGAQTITFYQRVILQSVNLQKRIDDINRVRSYHLLPLDRIQVYEKNRLKLIYKEQWANDLDQVISQNKQMLSSQIKCLVMQIAKVMLQFQKIKINHFRLCPKAISFKHPPTKFISKGIFIKIKDFSLGNEFNTVKEGKCLYFFDFLHPDLSLRVLQQNFIDYFPQYDIWSLGVILYSLIYFRNPFAKSGKTVLSKTLLRKYLNGQYQISFYNNKFSSLNSFIKRCLALQKKQRFIDWNSIKQYILQEEEIYNVLDFQNCNFVQKAQQHLKVMYLFSSIYFMILDDNNNSPHYFWKTNISENIESPFVTFISESVLVLMVQLNSRFQKMFNSHKFMLEGTKLLKKMDKISQIIDNQIRLKKQSWKETLFGHSFDLNTIQKILQICARAKMQMIEINNLSSKIIGKKSLVFGQSTNFKYDSPQKRILWKNIQVLYDFCHQIIHILNVCTNRAKYLYQKVYSSSIFSNLAINFYGFKQQYYRKSLEQTLQTN